MPKEAHLINDFSGGLNSLKDPRDIEDNQFSILQNLSVDKHGLITGHRSASIIPNCEADDITPQAGLNVSPGSGIGSFETDLLSPVSLLPLHVSTNVTGAGSADYTLNWPDNLVGDTPGIFWPFIQTGTPPSNVDVEAELIAKNTSGFILGARTNVDTEGYVQSTSSYIGLCASAAMFAGGAVPTPINPNFPTVYPTSVGELIDLTKYFPIGSQILIKNTADNNTFEDEGSTVIDFSSNILNGILTVDGHTNKMLVLIFFMRKTVPKVPHPSSRNS